MDQTKLNLCIPKVKVKLDRSIILPNRVERYIVNIGKYKNGWWFSEEADVKDTVKLILKDYYEKERSRVS